MPRRRPPESPETRQKILQAALETFAEKGYDGASTRAIAAKAGVNLGLLPYYFGDKEKLWQAAVDLAFAELQRGLDIVRNDPQIAGDRERAGGMIRAHVHYVAAHPEFVRLMHDEGKRRGPRMRWIVDRHVRPIYEVIVKLFESSRTEATERDSAWQSVDPVHFFYVLAGATGVVFHQAEECKRLSGIDPFDPAFVETHARVVEAVLLGGFDGGSASVSAPRRSR